MFMDTRLATTRFRIQQWTDIIKEKQASGLHTEEFCRQNGLSIHAYYYWNRKIKETLLSETEPSFVRLNNPASVSDIHHPLSGNQGFVPEITVSVDRFLIGINSDTPNSLLANVLETLSRV